MKTLSSRLRLSLLATLLGLVVSARAAPPSAAVPAVDHYVYLSFLPSPSELSQDAKANGLTIVRIDELADRVIVSYQYPDGHNATLGYALLDSKPAQASRPAPVAVEERPVAQSTARYVVSDRNPEVIYVAPPTTRVYYYNDPWYNAWAPLTVGFGLGWATSYYGGHYHYPYYGGHSHGGYHGGGGHHGGHGGGYHGGHGRR